MGFLGTVFSSGKPWSPVCHAASRLLYYINPLRRLCLSDLSSKVKSVSCDVTYIFSLCISQFEIIILVRIVFWTIHFSELIYYPLYVDLRVHLHLVLEHFEMSSKYSHLKGMTFSAFSNNSSCFVMACLAVGELFAFVLRIVRRRDACLEGLRTTVVLKML